MSLEAARFFQGTFLTKSRESDSFPAFEIGCWRLGSGVCLADLFVRQDAAGTEKGCKATVAMAELAEAAVLDDAAVLEEQHDIGFPNRRQTVRDDECRAVLTKVVDRRLDAVLGFDVESTRGFVEYQDRRI